MVMKDESFSVLLVESDPDDLIFFKKSLEENSAFPARIDAARSVSEAADKLRKSTYHVLLVESQLQDEEGLSLLKQLQDEKLNLPFVLMTPIRDDELARKAIEEGVADVIVKSESHFHQLAERLKKTYNVFHGNTSTSPREGVVQKVTEEVLEDIDESKPKSLLEAAPPTIKDELTGMFTHGYMHERIVREFSRASRYSYPLSCVILDIDHFKDINEEYGHRVGDALLKEAAALLFDSCRLSDLVARYGGTEFLVLLPHISYQGAAQLARRLRGIFEKHVFLEGSENIKATISLGASSYPEDDMQRRSDLITFARKALLQSKASGRDRTTLFRDLEAEEDPGMPKLEISEEKISAFQQRISEVADSARREYLKISRDLLNALESKDKFTAGHGANCAKYARLVAEKMKLSNDEVEVIEKGSLIHDIGKICIPDVILLKTGKLTFNEFEIIKQHTYYGYKVLKKIRFLREEALIVLHHHEWFNGEGYPCHLKGEEIPIGARICAVIDAFDTMRAAGARYKKLTPTKGAVAELVNMSGSQFDPQIVRVFIEVLIDRKELGPDDYDKHHLINCIKTMVQAKNPPSA